MPGSALAIAGTVVVSMISAYGFLLLRCRRRGNPFGPRARRWAWAIIVITAIVSTALGLAVVALSHQLRAAYVGLIVPSVLWLGRPPDQREGRRSTWSKPLVDGLMFPLRRLDDRMGDDMQAWCDDRSRAVAGRPDWVSQAAQYYGNLVRGRIKDEQARRDVGRRQESIEHKINVARLADLDSPARLRDALQSHPSTANMRAYRADDPRLADRLRSDAENELHLLLFTLYRLGFRKMLIYPRMPPVPPRRRREPGASAGAGPTVL